jgi:hypothetical protein
MTTSRNRSQSASVTDAAEEVNVPEGNAATASSRALSEWWTDQRRQRLAELADTYGGDWSKAMKELWSEVGREEIRARYGEIAKNAG